MDTRAQEIRAEDINPRFNWGRALPALGIMGVDFEERVDYRRLHRYRLSRVKQALEKSDLGALLVFDVNNIRYLTSTKIGEWERDKLSRWALLPRGGEPILWDFGFGGCPSQIALSVAQAREYARGTDWSAWHRASRFRSDGRARQGDFRTFEGGGRRAPSARRRH